MLTLNTLVGFGARRASGSASPLAAEEIWVDLQDISTLFQDLAATVPVTADGNPVAAVRNKGTLGGFLLAPNGGAGRVLYKVNGGYGGLGGGGEGSTRTLALTVSAFSPAAVSTAVVLRDMNGGNNTVAWGDVRNGNDNSRQLMHVPYASDYYMDANKSASGGRVNGANTATNTFADVVMQVKTSPVESRLYKNGTQVLLNNTVPASDAQFNLFVLEPVTGNEFCSVVTSRRAWSDSERNVIRAAMRAQVGL